MVIGGAYLCSFVIFDNKKAGENNFSCSNYAC